jgi:hypothetical protein
MIRFALGGRRKHGLEVCSVCSVCVEVSQKHWTIGIDLGHMGSNARVEGLALDRQIMEGLS